MATQVNKHAWAPERYNIYAFDPGVTTGFCHLRVCGDPDSTHVYCDVLRLGTFTNSQALNSIIPVDFNSVMTSVIVCENFSLVSVAIDKTPMEIMGAIEFLAGALDLPMYTQPSSARKPAMKWYPEVMKAYRKHAADALMHALVFASKQYGVHFTDIRVPAQLEILTS